MEQYIIERKCKESNDEVSACRDIMEKEDQVKQKASGRQVNLNMRMGIPR